jgi:hypothetical protein
MDETSATSSLSESEISTEINFNTTFLVYLSELKESKIIDLSFYLRSKVYCCRKQQRMIGQKNIQRLLMRSGVSLNSLLF